MKLRAFSLLTLLLLSAGAAPAAVIYSGIVNEAIPQDLEGVYLRLDTGTVQTSYPGDWATAPWINPFFGGVGIATSPLLRPVITGADQILQLEPGTLLDGTFNFALGENGSATHVGPGAGQWAIGEVGTIGVIFESTVGGPSYYGWVDVEIDNVGTGTITSWGWEDSGGPVVVPEPMTAAGPLAAVLGLALRRRRRG